MVLAHRRRSLHRHRIAYDGAHDDLVCVRSVHDDLLSLAPIPFKWQLFIFVALSLALLIFTRPLAAKKLAKKMPTNADSLIGKKVLVTERMTEFDKGAVKAGGIVWTARSEKGETIEKGAECKIVRLEGNTAVVESI